MDEKILQRIEEILDEPTCYPECVRKSRETRKAELLDWYEKYGDINMPYNMYGMDRVCAVPNDKYLDRGLFRKQRHDVNAFYYPAGSKFPYDYTLFMRDKLSFDMLMQSVFGQSGRYCPSVAYLIGSDLYLHSVTEGCSTITPEELARRFDGEKMVFKQTFGCSGENVRVVRFSGGCVVEKGESVPADEYIRRLSAPRVSWLLQRFIRQHEILNRLNETSVNTLRILTFHTGDGVKVGQAIMRFGKPGAEVDNADQGGLMAGIDEEGRLMPYAFSSETLSRFDNPFAGLKLPYLQEAKDLVAQAHSFLPGLFTIGWDVAFCPDGPMIIEGNDGWDPYSVQMPENSPLRDDWDRYLKLREQNLGQK